MADASAVLGLLVRQSCVLSLAIALLLGLRPMVLRRCGAGLTYAAWALLPLLMLAASLPGSAPAQALSASVWADWGVVLPSAAAPRAQASGWTSALMPLWALGLACGLLRLAWLQHRYARGLRRSAAGDHWWAPAGSGPALVGVFRPRMVLPLDFAQRFDAGQQVLVRCHEQVHREHHDNFWNLLATALCLLHWFNPLAWLAWRRMRADQELACDAAVMVRHPGSQSAYGRALLQAQGAALNSNPLWSRWQSTHPLTERIAMLKHRHPAPTARRIGSLLLLLLGLVGASAVHAWRAAETRIEGRNGEMAGPAAKVQVDVFMDVSVLSVEGGTSRRMQTRPRMRLYTGSEGTLIMNGTPDRPTTEQVLIKVKVTALSGGRWQLDLHVAKGQPVQLLAEPRLIVMEGAPGRIEVGDPARWQLALEISARRALPGAGLASSAQPKT